MGGHTPPTDGRWYSCLPQNGVGTLTPIVGERFSVLGDLQRLRQAECDFAEVRAQSVPALGLAKWARVRFDSPRKYSQADALGLVWPRTSSLAWDSL